MNIPNDMYVKEETKLEYCLADKTLINGYGEITETQIWK